MQDFFEDEQHEYYAIRNNTEVLITNDCQEAVDFVEGYKNIQIWEDDHLFAADPYEDM